MRLGLVAALIVAITFSYPAMGADQATTSGEPIGEPVDPDGNGLLKFIYGSAPENGILLLPFGIHTQSEDKSWGNNNLVGVVYNSFSAGTFVNSFHDRTWYLVLMRNIVSYHGFGIDYFVGLVYGYEGHLATTNGIPFGDTVLFEHNLNPVISGDIWYRVTEHLQLQMTLTPLVVLAGFKYNF